MYGVTFAVFKTGQMIDKHKKNCAFSEDGRIRYIDIYIPVNTVAY